jgi:Flp pilus assembly protein TadD
MRRLLHAVWPLAMLTIFVATFRRAPDSRAAGDAAPCGHHADRTAVESMARLERCVAVDGTDVEAMIDLGTLLEEWGRAQQAETLYRRALSVEPRDARVHLRLGRLLLGRGDRGAARREAELALQSHVGSAAALRLVEQARAQ